MSLLQEDSSIVSRMQTKWTPCTEDGAVVPTKIMQDCINVMERLLGLNTLPDDIRCKLANVDMKVYALLTLVWRYNSFGHHTDTSALCMYDVTSMMSHSCGASGVWHFGGSDAFCLRARVALRAGDEISISYLADEDLFKSVPVRREKTKGWLFSCACDRCASSVVDFARGFRCSACVIGSVFVSAENHTSACDTCASVMDQSTLDRYIELENLYAERVAWIDKSDVQDVEAVHKEAVNLFSAQHWVMFALETLIAQNLNDPNHKIFYMHRRLSFLGRTFPMANYTTAWLLEELGDAYLSLGRIETAISFFERGYWTLRILCGADHPFTESAHVKWDEALEQLQGSD